jgi:histidine ammonia-lyase
MDSLKTAVANIADLLDRQMALMVDQRYNNGLPANLSGASGRARPSTMVSRPLQISGRPGLPKRSKLTMPASVFSRSTECHNQDKVSMGTIAARDCLRVLELTEQVAAALHHGAPGRMAALAPATGRRHALSDLPGGRWPP